MFGDCLKKFKPSLHSAIKSADKNNGGQALHLLTITLKTDAGIKAYQGTLEYIKYIALYRSFSA